jgi:hypothetical protein
MKFEFELWIFFLDSRWSCTYLTLSRSDPDDSLTDTSIHVILIPAWAPRRSIGLGGHLGVWAHHPCLLWCPIFAYLLLILSVSCPWQCLVHFLLGRGLSSYKTTSLASLLLTPSFKLSLLPCTSISKLSSSYCSNGQLRALAL